MLIEWLIFLHVLGVVTFFLGHGAAAAMVFRIRHETNLDRIRAMLDLSTTTVGLYMVSFVVMGLTGLIMPFILGLRGEIWIWLSIVLMILVMVWMGWFTERTFKVLRRLVGLPYMVGNKNFPAEEPASPEEIQAHIESISIRGVVVVGYVIPVVILWLMVFRPF